MFLPFFPAARRAYADTKQDLSGVPRGRRASVMVHPQHPPKTREHLFHILLFFGARRVLSRSFPPSLRGDGVPLFRFSEVFVGADTVLIAEGQVLLRVDVPRFRRDLPQPEGLGVVFWPPPTWSGSPSTV